MAYYLGCESNNRINARLRNPPEERMQVLEPLVGPPKVVSRPVFTQWVEVLVFGIFAEGIERPARRPFHKDHDRPRCDTWLRLHHTSQPSERHDLSAALFHCCDRTARILAVEVVVCNLEKVEGVECHSTVRAVRPLRSPLSGGSGR